MPARMRAALIACGMLAALLFGVVQFASMAVYGDLARPPAVPALLPAASGIELGRPFGSRHAPVPLRIAYAQALLHRGNTAAAQAIVAQLPESADTADLRGQLAELRADPAGALPAYARARDFERAQRLIDARDTAGEFLAAEGLETQLVNVLTGDRDAGVRARALWRLGQITQEEAERAGSNSTVVERRALVYYDRALLLAPNEETYLLAAGQQALTIGDKAAAQRYYRRALEAVPNSADARAGLARALS